MSLQRPVAWRSLAIGCLATAWLAGCSASPAPVTPLSSSYTPAQNQNGPQLDAVKPNDPSQCNNGPMQVSPCYVFVGRGYGRYAQVTVHYPGGDQLRERNNCRRDRFRFHFGRDIARVRGAGQNWTVISGNQRGYCRATFTDLNKDVSISVQIHNARGRRR